MDQTLKRLIHFTLCSRAHLAGTARRVGEAQASRTLVLGGATGPISFYAEELPLGEKGQSHLGLSRKMWPFDKTRKNVGSASGLTSLTTVEQQASAVKIAELEIRLKGCEQAIFALCDGLKFHLDRIDENTMRLDKNMHNLAAMTLRPPKDLLGGGSEPN